MNRTPKLYRHLRELSHEEKEKLSSLEKEMRICILVAEEVISTSMNLHNKMCKQDEGCVCRANLEYWVKEFVG